MGYGMDVTDCVFFDWCPGIWGWYDVILGVAIQSYLCLVVFQSLVSDSLSESQKSGEVVWLSGLDYFRRSVGGREEQRWIRRKSWESLRDRVKHLHIQRWDTPGVQEVMELGILQVCIIKAKNILE